MKNLDDVTYFLKVATDILFVKNPISTSMGVLFGIILHGLVSVLSPFFTVFELIRNSTITVFHFLAVGIFGFNIKNYVNRHKVKPEIENAILLIEQQLSQGKLTRIEAKQQYRLLISKAVENARFQNEQQDISRSQN
ncbi:MULTISPECIES: hypothetical protein [Gammaproteobacteria]|uniref:hypothetical protein n=1 Tax=Gammaproteobacteria TaxID=1236 RepID=UPI00110BC71E|nr:MULTISPECIES: hypothetical protein [Gammaproteobacteria]MBM4905421.1 hypothetical protein [Vibrio parahaemolyticus]MBS9981046.1 hypothetical protein [Vibrio alginolyticus]MCS0178809.1 hypothetical protein [Vibrio alginolyticus]MCS0240469.1 hypothetical protein [Vibrio alginolyticus]TMP73761.1 hypothetical protein CWB75_13160 [Pseudoalteromonas sp. S1608]